ncbi:MAG: ROK family protein, partial [Streptosporangiaceae bacterium]
MQVLGIDIGGTGIKAAPVDTTKGTLLTERVKVETPRPAQPDAVAAVVAQHVKNFDWTGPVGIAFPGVVVNGVTMTAANLDPAWIGMDTRALFN